MDQIKRKMRPPGDDDDVSGGPPKRLRVWCRVCQNMTGGNHRVQRMDEPVEVFYGDNVHTGTKTPQMCRTPPPHRWSVRCCLCAGTTRQRGFQHRWSIFRSLRFCRVHSHSRWSGGCPGAMTDAPRTIASPSDHRAPWATMTAASTYRWFWVQSTLCRRMGPKN